MTSRLHPSGRLIPSIEQNPIFRQFPYGLVHGESVFFIPLKCDICSFGRRYFRIELTKIHGLIADFNLEDP